MKFYKLFTFVLSLCIVLGCTEKETQVEVSYVSLNTSTIEMVVSIRLRTTIQAAGE